MEIKIEGEFEKFLLEEAEELCTTPQKYIMLLLTHNAAKRAARQAYFSELRAIKKHIFNDSHKH